MPNIETINQRLLPFAELVDVAMPRTILKKDGTPSRTLIEFCEKYRLDLRWVISGESVTSGTKPVLVEKYRTSSRDISSSFTSACRINELAIAASLLVDIGLGDSDDDYLFHGLAGTISAIIAETEIQLGALENIIS